MENVEEKLDVVLAKEQSYIYSTTRRWEKRGQYTFKIIAQIIFCSREQSGLFHPEGGVGS